MITAIHPLWDFIYARLPELLLKLIQHLQLVGMSMLMAIVIAIPLGVILLRHARVKAMVLGFTGLLQTIPSLALLAFLLPFFGIGATSAIIALTAYALLPILRNTVVGLEGVDKGHIEAAKSLGLNYWYRLTHVVLPLSLPTIVAGIRTATAISVGIATLATFIGAGGLGDFINRGLQMNDMRLILLGAIPAALLALTLDFVIAALQHRLEKRSLHQGVTLKFKIMAAITATAIVFMLWFNYHTQKQYTLVVATKNFTEQFILGEVLKQLIEAHTDLVVDLKKSLGSTDIVHQAMRQGDVDIYPEYTGTGLQVILGVNDIFQPEQVYQTVKQDYESAFDITWLEPYGFENTQALAVNTETAQRLHIQTISDLKPFAQQLTLGGLAELPERPDGLPGLQAVYGLVFAAFIQLDPAILYEAVRDAHVDVIMAFSTNGRVAAYDLVLLEDDQHLFPAYYAATVARREILAQYPELESVLNKLAGKISESQMQRLNYLVDIDNQPPAKVAYDFLVAQELI